MASDAVGSPTASRLGLGVTTAVCYLPAVALWLLLGNRLPGGRWFAIHLFTLGVVTNLVAVFMPHFAAALTHAASDVGFGMRGRLVLLNAGVIATLSGRLVSAKWVIAFGAGLVSAAILWLYLDLRRLRKGALGSRFAFVVRAYERACAALLHGAFLGAIMGAGVLPGPWRQGVRLAHLHLNLLGWAGLTLLATLVTFGPVIARVQMEPGATTLAARNLPRAAVAVTVAAVALVFAGRADAIGHVARWVAGAALVTFAMSALGLMLIAVRATRRGPASSASSLLMASFLSWGAAMGLDIVGVVSGSSRLLDAAGVIFLGGVLLQTILAALQQVVPVLLGGDAPTRRTASAALAPLRRTRLAAINAGVAIASGVTLAGPALGNAGAVAAQTGWLALAMGTGATLGLLARARIAVARSLRVG